MAVVSIMIFLIYSSISSLCSYSFKANYTKAPAASIAASTIL